MAMLDGIKHALENGKTSKELEQSISKKMGEEDFYLEKDRIYRSEENVYESYTPSERDVFFGRAPRTVWENLCAFEDQADKLHVLNSGDVMNELTLDSYRQAMLNQWAVELHDRIIPNNMDLIRTMTKQHVDGDCADYDVAYWTKIDKLRNYLGRNTLTEPCLLARIINSLDAGDYQTASDLQIEMNEKVEELSYLHMMYKRNLF